MDKPGKRPLKINLREIVDAFDENSDLVTNYLDLETGAVIQITADTSELLETIYHEYFQTLTEQMDWEAAYAAYHVPDWQRQALQEAHQVELGCDDRYLRIPSISSHEGYEDMAEFTEMVKVKDARGELREALNGRGAFRRFKDVLLNYPELRKEWFAFQREIQEGRALDWLDQEDIQIIPGADGDAPQP